MLSILSASMIFSEFASLGVLAVESVDTSQDQSSEVEIENEDNENNKESTIMDENITLPVSQDMTENKEQEIPATNEVKDSENDKETTSESIQENVVEESVDKENQKNDEKESTEETVTTLKGEEIPISQIPEEYRDKLYQPKEGEDINNPFSTNDFYPAQSYMATSSSFNWPNNPRWSLKVRNFFNEHKVRVQRVAKAYNLYPSVMLAQAVLESGWGTSSLSYKYNNYFGIKSSGGSGSSVDMVTWEWIEDSTHPDGGYAVTIVGGFRSYQSSEESFRDYAQFLAGNTRRYRGGFRDIAKTPYEAIENIHSGMHYGVGGYATDPNYAKKISSVIRTYGLEQLDDEPSLSYRTHVEKKGDQSWVREGQMSGTSGQRLRLESLQIKLDNQVGSSIEYQTHVEKNGWMNWTSDGKRAGTVNQGKRLEAVKIRLNGLVSENYDVYYRVHAENFGWLDWSKNGEPAGTEGYGYRLEAVEIQLVPKGEDYGLKTSHSFKKAPTFVNYQTHVEHDGWQEWFRNGETAGTVSQAKRLEGLKINLSNKEYSGNITYRTHVQSHGWIDWVSNGQLSGTSGESKRIEAIQVDLNGEVSKHYDVYYRVHSQSYGWLGWTKNGQPAGTEGLAKRIESVEIKLVKKNNNDMTTSSSKAFIK